MNPLDIGVILAYFVGITLFGCSFYFRKGTRQDAHEFTEGGGNLPAWAVALSIFATYVSSISFLALPAKAYLTNFNAFVLSLSLPFAGIISAFLFVPYYRRATSASAYSALEQRFGVWARLYASGCFLLLQTVRSGVILFLLALLLNTLFGLSFAVCILITGLSTLVYSMLGGIRAVVWTDAIQSVILILGTLIVAVILACTLPQGLGNGLADAWNAGKFSLGSFTLADWRTETFWVTFVYGIFLNLQNFGIDQSYTQRYRASRTTAEAVRSLFSGAMLYVPVSFCFMLIGSLLWIWSAQHPGVVPAEVAARSDAVFPWFIVHRLPAGVSGLLVAAIIAAAMSTISGTLNAGATVLLEDYRKRLVKTPPSPEGSVRFLRVATVGLGFVAIAVAFAVVNVRSVLTTWWALQSVLSGGMLGLFLLGFFARRTTSVQAAVATVLGLLAVFWISLAPRVFGVSPFVHVNLAIVLGTLVLVAGGFLLPRLCPRKAAPAALLLVLCFGVAARADDCDLVRLKYNNQDAHPYLKVGLWAWPMAMDYDGDGTLDLVVSCGDTPYGGTHFFKNPGGSALPVFHKGVRVARGRNSVARSRSVGDGRTDVCIAGALVPDFVASGYSNPRPFGNLPANVHSNGVRGNVWRQVDFDGDGRLDVLVGIGDWTPYTAIWQGKRENYSPDGKWLTPPVDGLVYWCRNLGGAEHAYAKPELVRTQDGRPLWVNGNPMPMCEDWDGDGDLDILCGEFVDGFNYFENVGTRTQPRYAAGRRLRMADGAELLMELAMITPSAIDWDGDGRLDIVCGDEDGRVALIRNSGSFKDGLPVFDPPTYFRQEADEINFGCLSTPCGCDWDGDGDWDIVTGDSAGHIAFIENLSGPNCPEPSWAEPVRLKADGHEIRIMAGEKGSIQGPIERKWGYTCLTVADWDGDGLPDIMANSIWGDVVWYRNVGTRSRPQLAAAQDVEVEWKGEQPAMPFGWYQPKHKKNPKGILTQWRTTPVMFDWNGDGLMDLVMLDKEGYLAFYRRERRGDRLVLLPPERVFADENGALLRPNAHKHGASGRRKFTIADWNGDGRPDLIFNSRNAEIWLNVGERDGLTRFKPTGDAAKYRLAGHTSAPTTVDFDGDGTLDLLIGAEDGFFYFLRNPRKTSSAEVLDVWPNGRAPGKVTSKREHSIQKTPDKVWFYDISRPTLTHYRAKTGGGLHPAILICPGGGYEFVSWNNEGSEIADWFAAHGFEAFILKYRVPDNRDGALADAQRAISLIRANARELSVDPTKIGQIGFSAGANLTARTATHHARRGYEPLDTADKASCRPDFSVLVYPWTLVKGDNAEKELPIELRDDFPVDATTPPVFIVQTEDDWAHVENSLAYFTACKRVKVPAEMHLYAKGGHGYGMRKGPQCEDWPKLMSVWLGRIGVTKAAPKPQPEAPLVTKMKTE